jgi:hypothetical protein
VVEDGAFQARKRCGSKPLSTTLKSCARLAPNPIAACDRLIFVKPRPDPEGNLVNERGLVVETLFHSINRRHGRSGRGDIIVNPRYLDGWFHLASPSNLASDRRIHA